MDKLNTDNLKRTLHLTQGFNALNEENKRTFIEGYMLPELVRAGLFFEAGQVIVEMLNEELDDLQEGFDNNEH